MLIGEWRCKVKVLETSILQRHLFTGNLIVHRISRQLEGGCDEKISGNP